MARPTLDEPEISPASDEVWVEDEWEDDDYVYVPEDRGIVRKLLYIAVCLALFVFLVLGLGGYWLISQINPSGDTSEAVLLTIPPDSGLATISRLLEEKGIVSNATIFRYYAKWKNIPTIRAGEYDKLYKHDSMDHVIERLKQGPLPPKFTEITFPEGLWLTDTLAKIKEKYPDMTDQAIQQAISGNKIGRSKYQPDGTTPYDGFMFPATYRVEDPDKADVQKLLTQMVQKFDGVADEVGLGDATAKLNGAAGKNAPITPYQALIVASLVEAEAKVPEDRPRIARVIYNRLKSGMRLDIDATVPVALGHHTQDLTKEDLNVDSPYNTRRNPGLPPTPINSPGRDSLLAALTPSTETGSDGWLYYVLADKDGHHFFTNNYNEFLKAQQRARDAGLI